MKKNTKCYFCNGGPVIETKAEHISRVNGRLIEVKDVPCEVCQQCGEKYFDQKTIKRLEQEVKLKTKIEKYIQLPVYSYA